MSNAVELRRKIDERSARVGVIGLGYVGLPMAVVIAKAGFEVIGVDFNADRVAKVVDGESYILDVGSEELKGLVERGSIHATTDYAQLEGADIVLITVPTPLNKTGDPDLSFVVNAVENIKPHLHTDMLIILESTTYPGTTEELFATLLSEKGFHEGEDIFVAFSPERVDPGNEEWTVVNTPKVVGGLTEQGTEIAVKFYEQVVDTVIPVTSATTAEMVKIYENTFRAINIGLANELAIICNLLGVDVWEIVDAAKTKPFGFMPFYPGPGLGGHCIPVDPSYLAWKMKALQYKTRFIELATEVNSKMPEWIVTRSMEMLNDHSKALKGSNILLLGVAYKNDIDDLRESPAIDIYELLERRGATVSYHDPYCPTMTVEKGTVSSVELTSESLANQDLVIIVTGHRERVDYDLVLEHADLLFDTRNVTRGRRNKGQVKYL